MPEPTETFLQRRLRVKAEREQTPASAGPRNVVELGNSRAEKWMRKKLEATVDQLAAMPPNSGRNAALNAAAYSLGHYAPRWLSEQDVTVALLNACRINGLAQEDGLRGCEATISSGMSSGMDEPRDPPVTPDDGTSGLSALIDGTPTQQPASTATQEPTDNPDSSPADPAVAPNSWLPLDLGPYLDGTYQPPQPAMLTRTDGRHLIYPNRVHWISGEPEALKSWLALLIIAQVLLRGERAVYLDLEDSPAGITSRLLHMGIPPDLLRDQLLYLAPTQPLDALRRLELAPVIQGASVLIIDACTESLALQQLSPKDDVDVAAWLAMLPRWAVRQNLAVIVLDHVVKDSDNRGRWATGSQHKLAGLDGAAFLLEAVQAGGKGSRGRSRLYVAKDRHGEVRPATVPVQGGKQWVGDLIVDSTSGVLIDVVLEPPTLLAASENDRLAAIMDAVIETLRKLRRPLSGKEIEDRVSGRKTDIRRAIATLTDGGQITVERGPRNASLHVLTMPDFDAEED